MTLRRADLNPRINELLRNEFLSENKRIIVQKIKEYLDSKYDSLTNTGRYALIGRILDKINSYDPFFLWHVIDEALTINEPNSSFRDKVGVTAAKQLAKYGAGVIEILCLTMTAISLSQEKLGNALLFSILCFATDRFQDYVDNYGNRNWNILNGNSIYSTVKNSVQHISSNIFNVVNSIACSSTSFANFYAGLFNYSTRSQSEEAELAQANRNVK